MPTGLRKQLKQANRILHVVEKTRYNSDIIDLIRDFELSHCVTEQECRPLQSHDFFHDQAFQKRPTVGFNCGYRTGARSF